MNIRVIVLLLVAALAAGGAGLAANSWLSAQRAALVASQQTQPAIESSQVRIMVAKQSLPAGTLIEKNQLRWQPWPNANLSSSYMKQDDFKTDDLVGAVVRVGIAAGEPISETRVVRPGAHGFLAAILRPGYRAVSIKINDTTGIAGFVLPGDRVDLVLSHQLEKKGSDGRKLRVSETPLTDIRVLAVDQSFDDQLQEPVKAKNITLEVTPKQVEMVAVLRSLGQLSLSLRSLQPDEGMIAQTDGDDGVNPVLARLINGDKPQRGKGSTVDSEVSRFLTTTGGDGNTVQVVRGGVSVNQGFEQ